jgi:hypothetical protein
MQFILQCRLPVAVEVGAVTWKLDLAYYNKAHRAELVATGSNGKHGVILDGRSREVERSVRHPITVPAGSIRERIFAALVAEGKAVRVLDDAEE